MNKLLKNIDMKELLKVQKLSIGMLCLSFILFLTACNKDFPNTLRTEYPSDTTNLKDGKRKVLYIILDGVRGNAVSTLLPTNISVLARNSSYTYDGLTDDRTITMTNATGWANMVTGVNDAKHRVTSEDFSGNNLVNYPSLFTRLKAANAAIRTVSIASSASFNTNLAADATVKQTLTSDLAVKDALITELKTKEADLIVAQFHSADTEGAANGYETTNAAYTAAITTLDGYIGSIMNELKARPTYSKENWLVVVASNKGGAATPLPGSADLGVYGDQTRNSFVIYYNPKFSTQPLSRPDINSFPYVGFGPRFVTSTSSTGQAKIANTAIGNFGSTGEYSFMFKLRHDGPAAFYPMFLGKRTPFNSVSSTGWGFLFGSSGFQLDWGGSPRPGGGDIRDGKWHTIGFKIYNVGGVRTLSLFTDGKKMSTNSINGRNIDNTTNFQIGGDLAADGNNLVNIVVKDVALFNISMSDEEFASTMRKEMTENNPYFSSLVGWWPGNETSGTTMADMSGKGNPFIGNATVTRSAFEDLSPNVSPLITPASYRVVINNIDIPSQIYNWMGMAPQGSWGLDGKVWKLSYTDVRNN